MIRTENLKLNIIEGTDIPAYAPFNENFNKLDEFANTNNTNMENVRLRLDGVDNNITEIQNENSTQNSNISTLRNDIENVENDLTILEDKIKNVEFTENGETKKGELHTIKFEITPNFSGNTYYVKEYGVNEENTTRIAITNDSIFVSLDITNLLGVRVADNIDILSICAYSKGYYNYIGKNNPIPLSPRTLAIITPTGDTNLKLEMFGNLTTVTKQRHQNAGGVDIWTPTVQGLPQDGKVTIMLQAIIYK